MRIFLDNAATTALSDSAFQAMLPYLKELYGNPSASYQEGRVAKAALEKARHSIAGVLHASPAEIFFCSGGTEANNTALRSSVSSLGVQRIISSPVEHACVRNSCLRLQKEGVQLDYVKLKTCATVDLEDLEALLQEEGKGKTLVSIMHAHNELGTINDIAALAALCKKYGALFHSDTVQSLGQIPIHLDAVPVDFLSGSAHKLHGPKGIGFLYVRKGTAIQAFIEGGGQERQLRSGTEHVAGAIGFAQALLDANRDMQENQAYLMKLKKQFIEGLEAKLSPDQFRINGADLEHVVPKVLNIGLRVQSSLPLFLFKLDLQGLAVSAGSACSSGAQQGSAVMQELGLNEQGFLNLRVSFSKDSSPEEINRALEMLIKTI